MRQPLEERSVTISRSKMCVDYPSSFMFIAAMNPCPCGYYNHPDTDCTCQEGTVQRYLNKISGPLMDRIDLHVEVIPVAFKELSEKRKGEKSHFIRERVIQAREIQKERFKENKGIYCNAQMTSKLVARHCKLNQECMDIFKMAMEKLGLSARAYDRIQKVSRTIADLDNCQDIKTEHLAEAIIFRSLDRDSWGR